MRLSWHWGAGLVACSLHCSHGAGTPDPADLAGGEGNTSQKEQAGFGSRKGPPDRRTCSADLRDIVREDGTTVDTCPPDLACAAGVCVPACEASASAKGALGCSYFAPSPVRDRVAAGAGAAAQAVFCHAVVVTNGWGKAARLAVSRAGVDYDVTKFGRVPLAGARAPRFPAVPASGLAPSHTAVLFLSASGDGACPVEPALREPVESRGKGHAPAWQITSDVPVTAYDLSYDDAAGQVRNRASRMSLLLPTTAWGTSHYGIVSSADDLGGAYRLWGMIVAKEDGTRVDIHSDQDFGSASGIRTYTLSAGDALPLRSLGARRSAPFIASDKPISFSTETPLCMGSNAAGEACAEAHRQVPPLAAWPSEFAVAPHPPRRADKAPEATAYRLVAAVGDTRLTFDPPHAGVSAPEKLAPGQTFEFSTDQAFSVKSQDVAHPFHLVQMMSGCKSIDGGSPDHPCLGGPEYVVPPAPAQFLNHYVVYTDTAYRFTTMSIVRKKTAAGFKDVHIACLGPVRAWKAVNDSYEHATVELVRNGVAAGTCRGESSHTVTSDAPFGITVWGMDAGAAYAYAVGGNVAPSGSYLAVAVPK